MIDRDVEASAGLGVEKAVEAVALHGWFQWIPKR